MSFNKASWFFYFFFEKTNYEMNVAQNDPRTCYVKWMETENLSYNHNHMGYVKYASIRKLLWNSSERAQDVDGSNFNHVYTSTALLNCNTDILTTILPWTFNLRWIIRYNEESLIILCWGSFLRYKLIHS